MHMLSDTGLAPNSVAICGRAVVTMVDLAATDIMVFAGVDPEQAAAAVEGDTGTFAVASPPATARVPFRRDS